jgi:hypothetical protein
MHYESHIYGMNLHEMDNNPKHESSRIPTLALGFISLKMCLLSFSGQENRD